MAPRRLEGCGPRGTGAPFCVLGVLARGSGASVRAWRRLGVLGAGLRPMAGQRVMGGCRRPSVRGGEATARCFFHFVSYVNNKTKRCESRGLEQAICCYLNCPLACFRGGWYIPGCHTALLMGVASKRICTCLGFINGEAYSEEGICLSSVCFPGAASLLAGLRYDNCGGCPPHCTLLST